VFHPIHDSISLAFPDIKNLTSLGLYASTSAPWRDFLHIEYERVDHCIFHDRVQIPTHDALSVGLPRKLLGEDVHNSIFLVDSVLIP
jgi:hypothetical protein